MSFVMTDEMRALREQARSLLRRQKAMEDWSPNPRDYRSWDAYYSYRAVFEALVLDMHQEQQDISRRYRALEQAARS